MNRNSGTPIPILSLALALLCLDADGDEVRHVQANGTSKLYAEADHADWRLRLRAVSNTLGEASQRLDDASASLTERLVAAGFPEDSLRWSGISSGRSYNQRVFNGYFAERGALVSLSDLARRRELEKVLLEDPLIEIVRVALKTTRHEELRKEALVSAFEVAKEKAELLATAAGAELGPVLSIDEQAPEPTFGFRSGGITENRIEMPVFAAGEASEFEMLDYSMSVAVRFEIR